MRKKLLTVNDVIEILQKVENKNRVVELEGTNGYIDYATSIWASEYIQNKDGYTIKEIK